MSNELVQAAPAQQNAIALLFNPDSMNALLRFGELMAKSHVTIPKHLQDKPADCAALAMQAAQWGMNPYAVAQKTHITQGGALGYEAQLVNAVIVNSGALQDRPEFEFLGDWSRILGRVKEMKNDAGKKYYVADWDRKDEAGLGVIISATIRGERAPRSVTVMLSQAFPRFSTQWATDPQQQICYLATRKFARRYVPDTILGVYTEDELPMVEVVGEDRPPAADPAPKVARKTKAPPVPQDVTDAVPAGAPAPTPEGDRGPQGGEEPPAADAEPSQSPAPAPRAPAPAGGEPLIEPGQVKFLENKAKTAGADLSAILADMGGLVLDKLTQSDFKRVVGRLNGKTE
jgi:RecT family protein